MRGARHSIECGRTLDALRSQVRNAVIVKRPMACDPPLMDQERNFLNALEAVDHFEVTSTGWLRLFGVDGRGLVGLRR